LLRTCKGRNNVFCAQSAEFNNFLALNTSFISIIGCRGFAQISRLSDAILIPCVTVLCFIGSYAIHRNMSDVVVMLIFGVLGYLMRKFDLNNAAVVLALILGPISEKGLRGALRVSGGDISCLFESPVSWILIILSIVGIISPFLMDKFEKKVAGDPNVDDAVPDETAS